MRPHRRQPTRLPRPWDSPGKNTGVGCHFLLQCMKVKSLSCVRLLATPQTAAHQAPLSMGFSRLEYWSGLPLPSPCGQVKQCVIDFSAAGLVRTFTKPVCRANIQENSKCTISQKSYLTTKCFSTEKFLMGLIFPWSTLWKGLHGLVMRSILPHETFPNHQRTEENMGQNRLGRLLSCVLKKEKKFCYNCWNQKFVFQTSLLSLQNILFF